MHVARELGIRNVDNPKLGSMAMAWFDKLHPGFDKSVYNEVTCQVVTHANSSMPRSFNELFLPSVESGTKLEIPATKDYDIAKAFPSAVKLLASQCEHFPVFTADNFPEQWDESRAVSSQTGQVLPGRFLVRFHDPWYYMPTCGGLCWVYHTTLSWLRKTHDLRVFTVEKMILASGGNECTHVAGFLDTIYSRFGEPTGKQLANSL